VRTGVFTDVSEVLTALRQHGATCQKIATCVLNVVNTSNLTFVKVRWDVLVKKVFGAEKTRVF
jgi:hypothetical protein